MNRFLSRLVLDGSLTVALAAALAVVALLDRQRTPAGTTAARVGLTHEPRPDESTLLTPNRPAPVPANALAAAGPVAKSEKSPPAEAPHASKVTEGVAGATRLVGSVPVPAPTPAREPLEDLVATRRLAAPSEPYAARTDERRDQWINTLGGNARSEAAVAAGLEWLARHQAQDGSWSNQYVNPPPRGVCEGADPCQSPAQDFTFAQTGLALLALQASGHYAFNDHRYSEHVRRGLDFLASHQGGVGGLYQNATTLESIARPQDQAGPKTDRGRGARGRGKKPATGRMSPPFMTRTPNHPHQFMYEHGLATFALAEACAVARASKHEPDPRYLAAVRKAVDLIEGTQHQDGGWRYTPNPQERSDTSVTGFQVLALKAAREAGFPLDDGCLRNLRSYFQGREMGQDGRTGYAFPNNGSDAMTGVGVLAHVFLLGDRDCDLVRQAIPYLAQRAESRWGRGGAGRNASLGRFPGGIDPKCNYYDWYNCTLAVYMADGPDGAHWQRWNSIVRDQVIALQRPADSGCERGSWPCIDHYSHVGGRIYSTALSVLTLEVYYRYGTKQKD